MTPMKELQHNERTGVGYYHDRPERQGLDGGLGFNNDALGEYD